MNVVEQCVALTQTPVIPLHLVDRPCLPLNKAGQRLQRLETRLNSNTCTSFKMTDGNVTRAVSLLVEIELICKVMKKHELDAADFR